MNPEQLKAACREALDRMTEAALQLSKALRVLEDADNRATLEDEAAAAAGELESELAEGSAHLTGASAAAPVSPACKLVAEWPDDSRLTFGPFADERNARAFRPLAKAYLDPQAAAEAVWSVEPVCPDETLNIGADQLLELRG